VASKMDAKNTKMPKEQTTIKLTNLNSCMNNLNMFYKCALPLTTT
jgi:hypothetical protein